MSDETKMTADRYTESGAHLPAPLRDFHDQKDVFKRVWQMVERAREKDAHVLPGMNWQTGHIFVIDFFLWFMAKHGWTMQRSRARVDFHDLATTIEAMRDADAAELRAYLAGRRAP